MKFLTKRYQSFEGIVSFIGYCMIAILGLIFISGIVNPVYVPNDGEFIEVRGEIEKVEEGQFSILINLRASEQYNLKYLKRSGDWLELLKKLNSHTGRYMRFFCSPKKIYFRTPEDEKACFVFEIRDQDDFIRERNITIDNTSKLNGYFFIFGLLILFYGSIRIYCRLNKKGIDNT